MKLADAETLLAAKKREGPIREHWIAETDEGIVLECWPLGFARGSIGVSDMWNIIAHAQYSALFAGHGRPHHVSKSYLWRGHMWEQERYVYYLELRAQLHKMVHEAAMESPLDTTYARQKFEPPKPFTTIQAAIIFLAALTKGRNNEWLKDNAQVLGQNR